MESEELSCTWSVIYIILILYIKKSYIHLCRSVRLFLWLFKMFVRKIFWKWRRDWPISKRISFHVSIFYETQYIDGFLLSLTWINFLFPLKLFSFCEVIMELIFSKSSYLWFWFAWIELDMHRHIIHFFTGNEPGTNVRFLWCLARFL